MKSVFIVFALLAITFATVTGSDEIIVASSTGRYTNTVYYISDNDTSLDAESSVFLDQDDTTYTGTETTAFLALNSRKYSAEFLELESSESTAVINQTEIEYRAKLDSSIDRGTMGKAYLRGQTVFSTQDRDRLEELLAEGTF